MISHTNSIAHSNLAQSRLALLPSLITLFVLLAALSISGCTGLTSAGTTGANANSDAASSGSLAANATSFSFGPVATGASTAQTLTMTNTGTASVTISQMTITGAAFSIVGGVAPVSIAAGQNHAFQLQFAPQTTGNLTGSMVFASDAANSPLTVSLNGTGMIVLSITTQPVSQTVTVGQTATFMVAATGNGTLTYQWKKNGTAISGATASSYTTPATAASDNGSSFTVVVTDSTGNVTSNAATLAVTAAPVAPSITAQPAGQTVTAGQTATFSVTATGTATLTYQWAKNGTAISGATAASYITPATAAADNGSSFTVTITNGAGHVVSNAATLTVTVPPAIMTQPVSQTVTMGHTATFTVAATGSGTLTYQWKKNGTAISGATATSYTTPATAATDNGSLFTVAVTDAVTSANSNAATLTVNVAPSITTQPAGQTVTAGQTATFSVTATGTATLTYQWAKNGTAINGATAASYITPATAAADNGSSFTVTITNGVGNVISSAATLTVTVPPAITTQPVSQTVASGQTATFTVAATGAGTLTYQWKKNGTAISGATAASYIAPTTTASGSSFTVTVTSGGGSVTSNAATLTVNTAPTFTTQPASKTVIAGQTATFSVAATGTGTLTYQWNKNGSAINGATAASYTTPATAASDNGSSFTVVVTNSVGNVTSNAATLTVTAATLLLNASTSSLTFPSVSLGSSGVLSATFTNAGNSNVTISGVSISGAGYSASGVSTGQIVTPGQIATLNVTFTPASTGTLPGSVTVTSNAASSPATVSLSGTGAQSVSHSAGLTWTASTSTVSGYNVYRSTASSGPFTKLNTTLLTTTSYTDSTVQAGETYFYVGTSVDSSGAESTYSTPVSGTIPTP